jgi:hypothetical protein
MSAWSHGKIHSRRPTDQLAEDSAVCSIEEQSLPSPGGDSCLSRGGSQLFITRREPAVRSVGYSQLFFRAKYQLVILGIPPPRLPPGISTGETYNLPGYPLISTLENRTTSQVTAWGVSTVEPYPIPR